jgi:ribosomal protein RSM22 (predicted rRNA methylase)
MISTPYSLFPPLQPQTHHLLNSIPALIDKAFPLPARFRSSLPKDVAELSRLLTSGRGERGISYMSHPPLLSAYLRYFLPWNLYRLCRLLPDLDICTSSGDKVIDLGCGPLTFASALWICREDLRPIPLEFNCVDQNRSALEAGKIFFSALVGGESPWKINTIKGDLKNLKTHNVSKGHGASLGRDAKLVCAVNVFNEMYGDISRSDENSLPLNAKKASRMLAAYGSASSAFLIVEPGFPRCGEFISLLRGAFLEQGIRPLSPCPHDKICPMQGKKKWCHLAFETDDAPEALHRLSHAAGLPKERAVLSFLFLSRQVQAAPQSPSLRVISDAFPLPHNRFGRYCCSAEGLALLAGKKNIIEKSACGSLVNAVITEERDSKSGALIAGLA